jgi:three-Cys-motif partner protein
LSDERIGAAWPIQPHTEAKHRILAAYLAAWFPILSRGGFERVIYIDGFAGPGRYSRGQDGSPILALKALRAQSVELRSVFEFHFVESDSRTAADLKLNIADLQSAGQIPASAEIHVHAPELFENAYKSAIQPHLHTFPNAPAFALLDPFGWTGIPLTIMTELLRRRSSEILVNFMFEEINRFLSHPDQPANFDVLFGCPEWRAANQLTGAERRQYIHGLYRDQLNRAADARYVRSFEMRNDRGLVDYFLFFATKNLKGLEKMKEAMWRVDPSGGFRFSDATDPNQPVLFGHEPNRQLLRRLVQRYFAGETVTVGQVEHFVIEQTPFLSTHYKRVLAAMESDGDLVPVNAAPRRRPGTYGDPKLFLKFT